LSGSSAAFTKVTGVGYDLYAVSANGNWYVHIDELPEDGFIWDLQSDTELFPDNCLVYNFENNFEDQSGMDYWDYKKDVSFSSLIKKMTGYKAGH